MSGATVKDLLIIRPPFPKATILFCGRGTEKGYDAGRHAVTDPYIYASIDKLGITSVNPVHDKDKKFVGILGIDVMLETMRDFLDDFDIDKDGKIILITNTGQVIASQLDQFDRDKSSMLENILMKKLRNDSVNTEGSFIGSIGSSEYFLHLKKTVSLNGT